MPGQYTLADIAEQPTATPQGQGQYSMADVADASAKPATWLDKVKDFAGEWWNQVNPVAGVKGLAQAAEHPIQSGENMLRAQGALKDQAEAAFKRGDYAEGVRHVLNYLVPVLGPQTDQAGTLLENPETRAKGAGMTAGIVTNLAAPEVVKGAGVKLPIGEMPERMYQSALKPSTTMTTAERAQVVRTGLRDEIPVSAAGAEKLGNLISDLNDKIKATIASDPTKTINKFEVTRRLADTAKKAAVQVNPEADLQAIGESGNEFLRNQPGAIPVQDAQALKQGTYRQLGNKAYGELKSASIEAQKALARGIKEELEVQFPEIQGMNAQEGRLINLDEALERAVARIGNHQLLGIGTPIAGGAARAVTGSSGAGAAAFVLKGVLDNPMVKSKLAIALNQASKGAVTISAAQARIAGYSNALAHAANDASSANPATQ